MNIEEQIRANFDDGVIDKVRVTNEIVHGERAKEVYVEFNGTYVLGTFTTEEKAEFGGVQFSQRKDIPALMTHKIKQQMELLTL